ncbi:MAG: Periplasmic binding protein [Gaiellaceae bacterium]|nr:Periplasmic binding protein [Gaiellaceae bacterium]
MRRIRVSAKGVLAVASLGLAFAAAAGAAPAAASSVIVSPGAPVQIAFVADRSGAAASYYAGIRNAARMALQLQGTIRGFRVQLNDDLDAPCASIAQGVADANAVVGNPQNVAVIGHFCSPSLGGTGLPGSCPSPGATSALSIYERSGVVVINGSTTSPCLPAIGPSVFNATIISDPGSDAWYAQVAALPIDRLWQLIYQAEFGVAPTGFADLYFDATRVLLTRIRQTSRVVQGSLVIDRAALAQAVRHTSGFPGVTCSISLDPATGYRINDQAALARCALPFFGSALGVAG